MAERERARKWERERAEKKVKSSKDQKMIDERVTYIRCHYISNFYSPCSTLLSASLLTHSAIPVGIGILGLFTFLTHSLTFKQALTRLWTFFFCWIGFLFSLRINSHARFQIPFNVMTSCILHISLLLFLFYNTISLHVLRWNSIKISISSSSFVEAAWVISRW